MFQKTEASMNDIIVQMVVNSMANATARHEKLLFHWEDFDGASITVENILQVGDGWILGVDYDEGGPPRVWSLKDVRKAWVTMEEDAGG